MIESAPIVLVYLNGFLPKYAIKNLRYMENTFHDREIYVLVNKECYKERDYKLRRTHFVLQNSIDLVIEQMTQLTTHPNDFRYNFWNVTIARFFALENFMMNHGIESIFHFEADVLVAPYFSFEKVEKLQNKIAFPQVSDKSAAASVFYVNGIEILTEMNQFFIECLRKNPNLTDMSLLATYSREYESKYVSLFSGSEISSAKSSELFDAAAFGIYLTGGDPRNSKGWIHYFKDEDAFDAKPSRYEFSLTNTNKILAKKHDSEFVIQNLHIHSKNLKYFTSSWPSKKLISQIDQSNKMKRREFSLSGYYSLSCGFLVRRIRKILNNLKPNFFKSNLRNQ